MKLVSGNIYLSAVDLSNHLGCRHLTTLNRQLASGKINKPSWFDPALKVLAQRGAEHEKNYVNHLRSNGLTVVDLNGQSAAATLVAMKQGVDIIVQAALEEGLWVGRTDILVKVNSKSELGSYSYEVQDTKLSRNTRAATMLQLALYTDMISALQGCDPEYMHVVKPGDPFEVETFRYAEFKAYYRLAKKNLLHVIQEELRVTYPEPVAQCDICTWWKECDQQRHADDHLSLVAGIRTLHIEELKKQKLHTLANFAQADKIDTPDRGNKDTFVRKQLQAKIQLDGRVQNKLLYRSLDSESGRGLHRLPMPDAGDVYFDIEGDPFFPGGGLEYLLGYAYRENGSALVYNKVWATNRMEEKRSFEKFMQFIVMRWKQYPNFYIYHFAPYEPATIKRLARVHAIFEQEVDELLRSERFIDLHAVFKEALLASVERYSLKDLEKFTNYTRNIDLRDAGAARRSVESALELSDFKSLPEEIMLTVERYNEDDCFATEALHAWLEALRTDMARAGIDFQRPVPKESEANENLKQQEIRSQALFKALTQHLPEDKNMWSPEDQAKWLLAHQIDYFRREDKSAWWEYYRVHEMEHEALLDERKAVAGLQLKETLPPKPREKLPTHRYIFPPQEIGLSEGDDVREVKGDKVGTVQSVSLADNTIDIKKTGKTVDVHPKAIHVFDRIDPGSLWTSIMNLADAVDEYGLGHTWPYHASKDLLMRRNPRLIGGHEGVTLLPGEDVVAAAIRLALNLDKSILPIQGPPGTGKTYTGASIIIELLKAKKKVGVTAISHSVIRTLFEKVKALADMGAFDIQFVHKVTDKSENGHAWITEVTDSKKALAALEEGKIVGGTAWLWADDNSRETLDYLIIDEAGQMSLSHALAASRAAQNIILLGDPQQLEQPQKGSHPEGSDVAALTYLLEGKPTMPAGKGLFLDTTRRIHPAIARFTSEIFYEDRLKSLPGLEKQVVSGGTRFDGAGLFYIPVVHRGNQNKSQEEVDAIVSIVQHLLQLGKWTNAEGETRQLKSADILIVAPYNAQVAAIMEKLPDMHIGTVDKFQGKEAPIVIYSMTSSSIQDAPRGMSFLFSPNRLNVATSRAKSVCMITASPSLFEPECNTIEQMKWANALCRYRELAAEVAPL